MAKLNLRNLLRDIGNNLNVDDANSIASRFWRGDLGKASRNASQNLVNIQKFIESPTSKISLGRDKQYEPNKSTFTRITDLPINIAKGFAEPAITTAIKVPTDIGRAIGMGLKGNFEKFEPASAPMIFGQDIATYLPRDEKGKPIRDPFDTVGYYKGIGKWNIPFTNVKLPEFGLTESSAYDTMKKGLAAFEAPIAASGIKNVNMMVSMLGFNSTLGGVVNWIGSGAKEGSFEEGAWQTAYGMSPTLAKSSGLLASTNELTTMGKLPVQSITNVLQGVIYDETTGQETNGLSIFIDALFPVANEIGGKAFKNLDEAVKTIKGKIIDRFGDSVFRNSDSYMNLENYLESYVKNAKPYYKISKDKNALGVLFGFEISKDEEGKWKVNFNRKKAVLGLLLIGGVKPKPSDFEGIDDFKDGEFLTEAERYESLGMDLDNPNGISKRDAEILDISKKSKRNADIKKTKEELKGIRETYEEVEDPDNIFLIKNLIDKKTAQIEELTGKKVEIPSKKYSEPEIKPEAEELDINKTLQEKIEEAKNAVSKQDSLRIRKEIEELNRVKRKTEASLERTRKARILSNEAMVWKNKADQAYAIGNKELGDKYFKRYLEYKNQADIEYKWGENIKNNEFKQPEVESAKVDVKDIPDEVKQEEVKGTASLFKDYWNKFNETFSEFKRVGIIRNQYDNYIRKHMQEKILLDKLDEKYGYENMVKWVEKDSSSAPDEVKEILPFIRNELKIMAEFDADKGLGEAKLRENYLPHVSEAQEYAQVFKIKYGSNLTTSKFQSVIDLYNPYEARTDPDWIGDSSTFGRLVSRYMASIINSAKYADKLDVSGNKSIIDQLQGPNVDKNSLIPFDKKVGIFGERIGKNPSKGSQILTEIFDTGLEVWRDIGLIDMVLDYKFAVLNAPFKKEDIYKVYSESPDDLVPFVNELARIYGFKPGTKEYSDFYGDVGGRLLRIKDLDKRDNFAKALANEATNQNVANKLSIIENWAKSTDIKDSKTKSIVDRELRELLTNGTKELDNAAKALNYTRRGLQLAVIGAKVSTVALQPLEVLRAYARYGPKYTSQAIWDSMFNKDSISYKHLKDNKSFIKYISTDGSRIEPDKIDKGIRMLEDVGYYGIGKAEDWKNDVFLRAAELRGIDKGLEGDELGRYVLDEFYTYSHNFSNITIPTLMKNPLAKFALMFATYPTKQLDLMLRSVEGMMSKDKTISKESRNFILGMLIAAWAQKMTMDWLFGKKEEGESAIDSATGAITEDTFGNYGYASLLFGGIPTPYNPLMGNPFNKFEDGLIKNIYNFEEAKKQGYEEGDYNYNQARDKLHTQINRTLIPGGNQFGNVTFPTIANMIRGYEQTATGNVKYLAPEKPMDIVKSLLISKYANAPAQNYFSALDKGLHLSLNKNESEMYKQELVNGGNPRVLYEKFVKDKISTSNDNKILKDVEKTGEPAIANGKVFLLDSKTGKPKAISINEDLSVPELSGNAELDTEILTDYQNKLSSRKNDAMELYYSGYISQAEIIRIITEIDTIKSWVSDMKKLMKGTGGGGGSRVLIIGYIFHYIAINIRACSTLSLYYGVMRVRG